MLVCSIRFPRKFSGLRVSNTAGCRDSLCTSDFRGIAKLILSVAFVFLAASLSVAKDSSGKMELRTTAFRPGSVIPTQFTCSGANISPPLSWTQPPLQTRSFLLIVDDPDAPAGTWVHWVVYNLPASARQLPEHVPPGETVAGGGEQGVNDFPMNGYGGPCPPPGKPHRYFFRLYALDTILNPHPPVHRVDIDITMKGHILAQAEWMGTFAR